MAVIDNETKRIGGALTNMGISDLVSNLAVGIARGQFSLDQACMELASFMGEAEIAFGKRPDSDEPDKLSLLELGFTPNFYQFNDTTIEVKVAISSQVQRDTQIGVKNQRGV